MAFESCNRENMRLFIDALRSGRFVQGRSALEITTLKEDGSTSVQHCCLGVATRIAMENGVELHAKVPAGLVLGDNNYTLFVDPADGTPETGFLPPPVQEWLGVDQENPSLMDVDGIYVSAARANDARQWDYAKIADAFERMYLPEDTGSGGE